MKLLRKVTILLIGGTIALFLLICARRSSNTPPTEQKSQQHVDVSHGDPAADASPAKDDSTPAKTSKYDSPDALVEYIRQFAASGASANELYRKLAAFELQESPWWRSSEEVTALLELACDTSTGEQYRVVAMSIYLAAAPTSQISEQSATIEQFAIDAGDKMASAVLQGMADRSLAPSALTRDTLISETRGTGVKCYAWYAARLTQKNDADLSEIALAASDSGMTEASKVAFDYLASGSFDEQYMTQTQFQQIADALVATIQALPMDAGPMMLANGDAFIRAIPAIAPTNAAVNSLFSLLQEAQNPEMRLSAIEQLVSIHLSGTQDLSEELHEVRNQMATLFSDPVKQNRAKLRLNRIQAQEKSK